MCGKEKIITLHYDDLANGLGWVPERPSPGIGPY
jgi:hypothetical protein